ncbi:conjugal transfer mating pair stabilization protein TraN [Salmonella enterica subsp. enterica serovar Derby]|uniref:Conjugal transfer mating pair stabilization protein TraN n=3 Tax=Salmonella enterica TaxID=28901 RepID=A0A3V8R9Z4_SALDE|nr:conjugal transfer mating pair stabilization protein TraN [Salmonella enterica]EAW2260766.1 conjugal transfer mating pair stabilization protein TraN [Salmonella enterica subsp. enterica]EAY2769703.1 conjugal transfer mating pair stabilization protein TraN [Salmonella enterica subsp. enterica serovar Typhimurium]EBE3863014.1 conjugal transfer mating pair stabilization protein TraN [Salmonella enterica subsp. enterica serovar Agona]EDS5962877.1 conjugal transfer mating pair stabilization protei
MSTMPPIMTRFVASLLCLTISVLPIHSYAGNQEPNIGAVGRDAKQFGLSIANEVKQNSAQVQDGKISLPVGNGQSTSININELFPGVQPGQNTAEYFPDAASPEELEQIFSDADAMDQFGNEAKANLFQDANSSNPSISGSAYQVLMDAANRSRPDFSNDPVLNLSKKTYEDMDLIAGGFGDCSAETTINQNTINAHIPEYERCQRVVDQSADCEVVHDYDASVVKHYDGPYNLKSCGDGCTELWIGKVGDDYWAGNCKIYEEYTRVQVSNPDAIVSATLEYVKWDDYMQVWVGKSGQETKVWSGPDGNFPPETAGRCELSTSWERNPNVDVTPYFKNVKDGDVVTFKIRVSVTGEGEGFGRIKLRYDPSKAITKDEWAPQSCMDSAKGVVDGFAEGEITCIDDPTDATGCTVINGVKVCESQLKPSPFPGIPKLCKKVRVKADYDFYKGQMDCWTDPQGETHCPVNTGGNLNSCQMYEDNPQCGFISSECIDGAEGSSGKCYVFKDTYDCGTDISIPTLEKETTYQCGGPIRCMGDDCLDITKSQSTDFARASALLNAAQFMTQDMSCTGQNYDDNPTGEENVMCSAFAGEAGECKIAVGGVSDCCEKPTNISFADYLNLIMAVPKLDGAVMGLSDGSAVKGAYQVLRDPVMSGWTEITQPFASYIENISGAVDSFLQPVQQFAQETIGALKEQITKLTSEALGNASATGAAGVPAGAPESMTEQILGQQGAAMLSTVMTVYTVYVVSMVMIQMIWKCEEKEFTMNAKRALNSCTYVGSYCKSKVLGACVEERESYCCFNSPLSRIIQEQVRPQLGLNFGDARTPQCGGIPLDRIADIDWSKVNLDEWLGILQQNGKLPDPASLNLDALTGAGSDFNIDGTRQDASERIMERLEGINVDKIRNDKAREIFPDLDGNGG